MKGWKLLHSKKMRDLDQIIQECLEGIDPLPMTPEEERLIRELDDPRDPLPEPER